MTPRSRTTSAIALLLASTLLAGPAMALDDAHWKKADEAVQKGVAFLKSTQNADGSWSPKAGPAITALVITAMLDQPGITQEDPTVRKGLDYILSMQKPDGGIHSGILANYNTAISLSALARVRGDARVAEAIKKGQAYLRGLQWTDQEDPQGAKVNPQHPFFGGVGYGKHGRPDGSNTQYFVQAFYDIGADCKDPAIQRAVAFFSRLQGSSANDKFANQIQQDGGAIYATSINKHHIGVPQSQASQDMIDEGKAGKPVSNLRTYGSMTYAMFKTYVFAQLPRDDVRVVEAVKWISNNFTVDHNPGMPEERKLQGYYYYLITMARALDAWNSDIRDKDGKVIQWQNAVINALARQQREDGSWLNEADRWMEGDPNLVTAYSLIALTQAMR